MRLRTMALVALGAAIGVLAVGNLALADEGGRPLTASLTGAAEVPGPGDPDASGFVTLTLNPGQEEICFNLEVSGIPLPADSAGAHIHVGAAGTAGGVVVALLPAGQPDAPTESGCVSADRETILAILQNPENYYVNVHTFEFPNGAIRGQLG
jgi:CHRD domain